jgi:sRNA-binding protein
MSYLQCLKEGQPRYDLAHQVCGEVTGEEEVQARKLFKSVAARKRAKRRAQEEMINAVGRELFSRWPQVFGGPPHTLKPLKHGLEVDLAEYFPEVTPVVVKQTLTRWKKRRAIAYLRAVAAGGNRYDLQDEVCGEVTAEEAAQQHVEVLYAEQEAKSQKRGPGAPAAALAGEHESQETETSDS